MIKECLEYLKQASTNPKFDNDYQIGGPREEEKELDISTISILDSLSTRTHSYQ